MLKLLKYIKKSAKTEGLACKNRRIPSCSHMYLTKEISRMRFVTDMLLNNKIKKQNINNKVCLNNVMDATVCVIFQDVQLIRREGGQTKEETKRKREKR